MAIGLSFLVTFFLLGQLIRRIMGETQWAFLLRESLLIGGWVAMWKPLEIFLYDWWPIVGERRLYDRLSRIKVQIIQADSRLTNPQTFGSSTMSPISSNNTVPRSASRSLPGYEETAPVNAPRS